MFCSKCGQENKEGAKFCTKCGTKLDNTIINHDINESKINEELSKVDGNVNSNSNQNSELKISKPSKKSESKNDCSPVKTSKRKNESKFYAGIFVIVCLCIIAVSVFFGRKSVTFFDANSSSYIAINGNNGNASIYFDDYSFKENLREKINKKTDELFITELFVDSIACQYPNASGLNNGSKVTISCSYDKELAKKLKLRIKKPTLNITITGLTDQQADSTIDPFGLVDVEYEKVDNGATIDYTFNVISKSDLIDQLGLKYEVVSTNLPSIEVSCTFDEQTLSDNGYTVAVKDDAILNENVAIKTYSFDIEAPQEETADSPTNNVMGKIRSAVDKLNVRADHSTDSEKTGIKLNTGDEYEFIDTYFDGEFTWYCIDANKWVADNGKWLEVTYY